MKSVRIDVKSARLILNKAGETCDKVFSPGDKSSSTQRTNFVNEENPITESQISNMLHVLMGKRPVPSFRRTEMMRDERIDEIARNCYMRIENSVVRKSKDNKTLPVTEFISGKKNSDNSHKKFEREIKTGEEKIKIKTGSTIDYDSYGNKILCGALIEWDTVRYKLRDRFELLVEYLEKISGEENIEEKYKDSFPDMIIGMRRLGIFTDERMEELFSIVKSKPIVSFLKGDLSGVLGFNNRSGNFATKLNFTHVLSRVIDFNCSFVFFVTDDEYEIISKGKRCATYLDGGSALFIKENQYDYCEYELESEGYKRVDEINDEIRIIKDIKK